jgi:glycosyltransferase involved in cell wall biosynthesis
VESTHVKGVCFFGGFVEGYPRSDVLRKGLGNLGVPVRLCRVSHKKKLPSRYAALTANFLRMERDFDVILVPEFRHKDVPLAAFLAKLYRKLCVFDPLVSRYDTKIKDRGDARDRSFQSWHNRNIDRVSLRLPDLVLADTKAHADYYLEEFLSGRGRVEVVPVGYDEALFSADASPSPAAHGDGAQTVLFYGSYLPLHGVETIVAAAEVLRHEPSIRFELIGGGQTFAPVDRFVRRHDLGNVRLTGPVPVEELPGRIASATVCLGIFGNTEKARRVVPNKVYQCMAMGKAVVTERSPAIEASFEHGRDVILVPPADTGSLASAIRDLCRDAEKRDRIARNAMQRVAASYTSRRIAELFVDHCTSAMLEKGRRTGSKGGAT